MSFEKFGAKLVKDGELSVCLRGFVTDVERVHAALRFLETLDGGTHQTANGPYR